MKYKIRPNKEGKLPKQAIADMQAEFKNYAEKWITVTIEKYKKKRSNEQNAYYWGVVVKLISDETGYTKEEIHDLLASHFIGTKKIRVGGIEKEVYKSSTELTTSDFMGFIAEVQRWAAEKLSLYLPDPNEFEKSY